MTPLFAAENVFGELLWMLLFIGAALLFVLPGMISRWLKDRRLYRDAVEEEWRIVYSAFGDMQGRTVKLALEQESGGAKVFRASAEDVDIDLTPGERVRVKRTGDRIWSVRKIA